MNENNDGPKDALDWTPQMALEHALQCCGEMDYDASVTILLCREGGQYVTRFVQSGMTCSEMVALLEIQKSRIISRQINGEEGAGV